MASITHKRTNKGGKDVWLVRVCVDGKQVAKTVTGTLKQAERVAYDMEAARDAGDVIKRSRLTCGEYMSEWLATYHRPEVTKITYMSDSNRVNLHIAPTLGPKRLDALHTMDIQKLLNDIVAKGQTRTAVMVYNIMKKSLSQAKRLGMISRNPMDNVIKPKDTARERPFLTLNQGAELIESAKESRFYALISFLLLTGTRPEEALGLKWTDIDLSGKTVSVKRALKRIPHGGWEYAELKTRKSQRLLDIGQSLADILSDHKRQQAKARLAYGARWHHHNLVFTSENGEPVDMSKLRAHLQKAIERAKLPRITLYDLRHSHGSMMLESGVHIKAISDRLGHANGNMTINRYLHVSPDVSRQAVDALEKAMHPDNAKQGTSQ